MVEDRFFVEKLRDGRVNLLGERRIWHGPDVVADQVHPGDGERLVVAALGSLGNAEMGVQRRDALANPVDAVFVVDGVCGGDGKVGGVSPLLVPQSVVFERSDQGANLGFGSHFSMEATSPEFADDNMVKS